MAWSRGASTVTMEVAGGKIYILEDATLIKVDQKILTREASVDLDQVLAAQQGGEPQPNPMFQRFDINQDGKITQDELPRQELWDRLVQLDKNADGALTIDEIPSMPAALVSRSRGPTTIKIAGDDVLVVAANRLFKFSAADLKSQGVLELREDNDQEAAEPMGPRAPRPTRPAAPEAPTRGQKGGEF